MTYPAAEEPPVSLSCPVCGRPLRVSSGRCPSCGTTLLLGVQGRRAGVLVGFGFVIGLLMGGMVLSVAAALSRPATPATVDASVPPASASPVSPAPSATSPSALPPEALSAISQAAVIDARLVGSYRQLRVALAGRPLDTSAVATSLRALTADATTGADIVRLVGGSPEADQLGYDLRAFYASIRSVGHDGLASTLADSAAYSTAGKRMVALFGHLADIDTRMQQLAVATGLIIASVPPATGAPGPGGSNAPSVGPSDSPGASASP